MPLDLTSNPAGVFYRAGKVVAALNAHAGDGAALEAQLVTVRDPYDRFARFDLVQSLPGLYAARQDLAGALMRQLAGYVDLTILDDATVQAPLGISGSSLQDVVAALRAALVAGGQTFKRCVVTPGAVTAGSSNVGNGTVLVTKILDGVTPPLTAAPALAAYAGLNSELAVSETMTFACTADSVSGGTTEGGEYFLWSGATKYPPFDWRGEGSGRGPNVAVAGSTSILANADLQQWNGNMPSGYTLTGGTAGVNLFQESGAGNVFHGTTSLKLLGDGATGTIGIAQAIVSQLLTARRLYCVWVRVKASGVPAAGRFQVFLQGTGYAPAASEKIDLAAASFPTAAFSAAGSLLSFFVLLPAAPLPSDLSFVLQCSNTLSNGVAVYVGGYGINPVRYHGGLGAQIVPGTVPFRQGDSFTLSPVNDGAGIAQEFFRRWCRVQMPSATSGSETILDALFT